MGAREFELDASRVGSRRDHEVILQLTLISVVHEVYTWVDARVFHVGVVADIGAPLRRIVPQEVVAGATKFPNSAHRCPRVGLQKSHSDNLNVMRRVRGIVTSRGRECCAKQIGFCRRIPIREGEHLCCANIPSGSEL